MAPEKPPPLPISTNRLTIMNQLALSASSRLSRLRIKSASQPPKPTTHNHDNDDSLFRENSRPGNDGLGYKPDSAKSRADEKSKQDKFLRDRLLSKGKGGKGLKMKIEEEEDEDPGRSSLGKRKRERKAKPVGEEVPQEKEQEQVVEDAIPEAAPEDESGETKTIADQADATVKPASAEAPTAAETEPPAKKKKQKKKKQGGTK